MKPFFLIMMAITLFCTQASGESFKLLSAEIPPYSSEKKGSEGICIDLAREVFKRSGIGLEIQFLPWARAQNQVNTALQGQGFLIAPLTRVPEREVSYEWLLPLYEYQLQILTNDSALPVQDEVGMKEFEICVLRESPAQYLLEKKGFKKVHTQTAEGKCLQLLKHKRIKAVFVHGALSGIHNYKEFDGDPKELIKGLAYPGGTLYLAASKGSVPDEVRKRLQSSMDEIRSDGTYDRIIGKYED